MLHIGFHGSRRRPLLRRAVLLLAGLALASCAGDAPPSSAAPSPSSTATLLPLLATQPIPTTSPQPRLLVFSRTAAFRHDSIPAAVAAIEALGMQERFAVDATEDPTVFSDAALAQYRAVVFLMTTGDVLDNQQQAAFERFIRAGNGYAGVHSASDTEYDWPWYGGLVGAYFREHPAIQPARIVIEDPGHASTAGLPAPWLRTDEWYSFRTNPRADVRVLLTLDEGSYAGGTMGLDHPIAWYHPYDGGRAWYTALGHTAESYAEPAFLTHLLGGLRYAAALEP